MSMFLSALATLLYACATSPRAAGSCEQRAALADACIGVESLAEWQFVDERTLLLWAPEATRAHLLRLGKPIAGLSDAEEIDVVDGDLDGLICACGHDALGIEQLPSASARISSIEHLTEKRTVELLASGQ